MTAKPRTLAQLISHPWVESVSDERSSGCGIWIYLKPGYEWDGSHTVHESTVRECCAAFSAVVENPADDLLQDAPRPVLPGEQTPPAARSHGDAAPTLPELRADAAAGRPVSLSAVVKAAQSEMAARRAARRSMNSRRRLHPMAEMLLMRLAATREPWLAVERLPLWDSLADAGWIELGRDVHNGGLVPAIACRITDAGRAVLDVRPSV